MSSKKTAPVYGLLVPTVAEIVAKATNSYGGFSSASFDVPIVNLTDEKVRNLSPSSFDFEPRGDMVLRFHVYRQLDQTFDISVALEWRSIYSLSFHQCATMAKFAAKIERALNKLTGRFGYARGWAENMRRCCDALNVTRCAQRTDATRATFYTEMSHRFAQIGAAESWLADIFTALEPVIPHRETSAAA